MVIKYRPLVLGGPNHAGTLASSIQLPLTLALIGSAGSQLVHWTRINVASLGFTVTSALTGRARFFIPLIMRRELKGDIPSQFKQFVNQVQAMDNPFQQITDAFHPDYRVNLSIQGLDGTIMLTLSNQSGVVAKRLISQEQRNSPKRLRRLIESVQFGIAIEQGHSAIKILAAMTDGDLKQLAPPAANSSRLKPSNVAMGL